MKTKVFVALDTASIDEAKLWVDQLGPVNPRFKIGLELFVSAGPRFVEEIAKKYEIFLDLKFHDIPNTVAGAARSAARLGVHYFNIHCSGGVRMLSETRNALDQLTGLSRKPKLLGVTVLTSLADEDLLQIGFTKSASAQVKTWVELAEQCGLDGVVCAASEIPLVKSLVKEPKFETMVPGIRLDANQTQDQRRVETPEQAAKLGANSIVLGRAITKAEKPSELLQEVVRKLENLS
ncbi:MAG: orotidine-5'-phosphate decarboxylase [Oligoflexia bacterium]|nr:orotidine-5'-phosphate decarboxylase [Oligoflexia bacterium]